MDINTAARVGSEEGFTPANFSFDDMVQTTRIADMATSDTPPLLEDAQPKPLESIVLVKMIADAAEALVGRMQTLDPENAATIATQLSALLTTLEQIKAQPSLGRTLNGAIGNLMNFISAALGRDDAGLLPFQGAELSDLAGKVGASLNALGAYTQVSPLQAAAQAATMAKLASTLGVSASDIAASVPFVQPNSVASAMASAAGSIASAAASAVGVVEPEPMSGPTEIGLPDGAKNDGIAKKLLTIVRSLNGTLNQLDGQPDRGDFPVPMDAQSAVAAGGVVGGDGAAGIERAMSVNPIIASAEDVPPSAIGAGATVSFNFNPAELFRVGKISKAIKAAFRNRVSPAAADALARQLERFTPIIDKIKNLGIDPSKVITMEIANPYNANSPTFDPKLVIALNMSELRNLLPDQVRDLAMTIGALTLPGSAEQNGNVALEALLLNAVTAPDGTNGPGDFRISITGGGYKFGTSYGVEFSLGRSLSTLGLEAEIVAEIAPDGTRSLEFALRLAEKRTITGDGQRDFPSGIDFGGAVEASISLNESDLFRTANGQVYMRVAGGDGVVSVPLPSYLVAALGYDPAKLNRRELSADEQTMDLQAYSTSVLNGLQQSLDPNFVAAMETIGRFLGPILAIANPFGWVTDGILGNEGQDQTGVTRLPGGGRVINSDATQAEAEREIIGRLVRGPQAEMDRFIETYVNRYLDDRAQFNKPALSSSLLDQFRSIFKTILENTLDAEEAFRLASGTINGREFNVAPPLGVPDPGENPNERVRVWVADYSGSADGRWEYLYRPGPDGSFNPPDSSGQWVWLGFETVTIDPGTDQARTGYVGVWGNLTTGEQRLVALASEGLSPNGGPIPPPIGPDGEKIDVFAKGWGYLRAVGNDAIFLDGRGGWFIVPGYSSVFNGWVYVRGPKQSEYVQYMRVPDPLPRIERPPWATPENGW